MTNSEGLRDHSLVLNTGCTNESSGEPVKNTDGFAPSLEICSHGLRCVCAHTIKGKRQGTVVYDFLST